MKSNDAFSDLSWGNLQRYKVRNDKIVREKRAIDLDKRIREMWGKTKNVEWALNAVDFCQRETAQNKDVFPLSKEVGRLTDMQKEANRIIEENKARIAEENQKRAAKIDEEIKELGAASRNTSWAYRVTQIDNTIRELNDTVRNLLKERHALKQMLEGAARYLEAEEIDQQIRNLMAVSPKQEPWLKSVDALDKSITDKIRPLLKEAELYQKLKKEYKRVEFYPIYSPYEDLLNKLENEHEDGIAYIATFNSLDADLRSHQYSLGEYIRDFSDRWSAAKEKIDEAKRIVAAEEADRIRIAKEKRDKEHMKPYSALLTEIETGGSISGTVRSKFHTLDSVLHSFDFSPDVYCRDFTRRWKALAAKVAAEEKRLARQEFWLNVGAGALVILKVVGVFLLKIVPYILPTAIMCLGFLWLSIVDMPWYTPLITVAALFFFMHTSFMNDDCAYTASSIIFQILMYVETYVFSTMFGYGYFNMIVSAVVIAIVLNTYPHLVSEWSTFDTKLRIFQGVGSVVAVLGTIFGLEKWLRSLMLGNYWHALWVVPVMIVVLCILSTFSTTPENTDSDLHSEAMNVPVVASIILGLYVLLRAHVFMVSFSGAGFFGVFGFMILQVAAALVGFFIGIMLACAICSELD